MKSKSRALVEALTPHEDGEVRTILNELRTAGFHISNTNDSARMEIGDEGDVNITPTGEDDQRIVYDVYPDENWEEKVNAIDSDEGPNIDEWDEDGPAPMTDWIEYAETMGNRFEEILSSHDYEVGSSGGHPPNMDFNKQYDDGSTVIFAFWGNPYHV